MHNVTNTNISRNSTNIDISASLGADQLLKTSLSKFGVVKECRVGVNIGIYAFIDELGIRMNFQIFMKFRSPGVLYTVTWPENLLSLGRSREDHSLIQLCSSWILDLAVRMKLSHVDVVNEGHVVRGMPVKTVTMHVEWNRVDNVINWGDNL